MDSLIVYAVGVGVVALLSGVAISFVVRGAKARREKEMADAKIRELNEKIAAAAQAGTTSAPAEAPKRWTVTEVVALVGAVGTLLGAIGTFRNTDQSRALATLKEDVGRLEREKTELKTAKDAYERDTLAVITYEPASWRKLVPLTVTSAKRKKPVEVNVSDKFVSAPCHDPKQVALRYDRGGPALLRCEDAGRLTIALEGPTKLLLLPQ